MFKHLRGYLIAGLLVWLPIWATWLVMSFIFDVMDSTLALLPKAYQPQQLLGVHIPGLGILLVLIVLFATGIFVTNILGKKFVALGEAILARIPLVRTIYHAVKQILETLFSSGSQSFRKVYLVEYPRKGLWSIAFQTGNASDEVCDKTGKPLLTIFIPTTPNPTSGFLMMIDPKDAVELDMTIDEALKVVISLGVVKAASAKAQEVIINK